MRSKVCAILGAGASKDASAAGGPPTNPNFEPPLAKELFGRRTVFTSGAAAPYRGVRVLASELGELGGTSLEAKLVEFARDPRPHVRRYFRQVPPYLRDLLLNVSVNYTKGSPGNHVRLALNLLKEHEVAFFDLNYDDYLERALPECDPSLVISNLLDYVQAGRQAIVGKVRGSINWGTPIGEGPNVGSDELFASYETLLEMNGFDPLVPCKELIFAPNGAPTLAWRGQDGRQLYPVLTAPLAGKDHTALVCPKGHLEALAKFLAECTHYLVIGTSGLDDDLLGFLSDYVRSVVLVHYVNLKDGGACQGNFQKGVPSFAKAHHSVDYDDGLRLYLGSQQFRDFLTA